MTLPPRVRDAAVIPVAAVEVLAMRPLIGTTEIVLYGVAVLALFFRRRRPVPVLVAALPVTFAGHLLIAPMIALFQVARSLESRRAVYGWALAFFVTALGPWWPSATGTLPPPDGFLFGVVSSALMCAGPTAAGQLSRARRELAEHIVQLSAAHQREAEFIAERAVVAERARMAREMHDVVSYQVSLMTVQAGALERTAQEPAARETASLIRGMGVTAMEELRGLVRVLRSVPGNTAAGPRLGALPALIAGSGLDVSTDAGLAAACSRQWPTGVEEAAYRTVQEALTNARKHAPGAPVSVSVDGDEWRGLPALRVEIRNGRADRVPADRALPSGGHGLTGLRERADQLGGELLAEPTADGFRVRAVFPCASPVTVEP
ncbi:signal transduction histidine kinase [Streptomyces olivoverticillatus]|uniref:histidine kinase n=1 Tax=Streptomyces olivoverticillatus TaxID=66427 RepID=A0A7W7LJ16_9ACTN|nr:histidine kinase [Streptomyces olivoverticillatus]MBB4891158.1 signal transduction histidine kinase [Streptomyces olivoverticillatus]